MDGEIRILEAIIKEMAEEEIKKKDKEAKKKEKEHGKGS